MSIKTSLNTGELVYVPVRSGVINSGLVDNSSDSASWKVYAGSDEQVCHSLASILHEDDLSTKSTEYTILVFRVKKNVSLGTKSIPSSTYTYQFPIGPEKMVVSNSKKPATEKTPTGDRYYYDPTLRNVYILTGASFVENNFEIIGRSRFSRPPISFEG